MLKDTVTVACQNFPAVGSEHLEFEVRSVGLLAQSTSVTPFSRRSRVSPPTDRPGACAVTRVRPSPRGTSASGAANEVFDVLFYMDAEGQSYDLRQTPLKAMASLE